MKQEHEMTPGVLVSGEVLSAGDARARVAVLEAEVAELRKRVCVPEGYVVVPVEPTEDMLGATSWPRCAATDYKHMLAAAPAPVERVSQNDWPKCDYCGEVPDCHPWHGSGMFNLVDNPHIHACTDCRHLLPAPVERVGQDAASYYERAHGKKSPTYGMSLDERIEHVEGRTNAAGYIEFDSVMAVSALIDHVLRDSPAPKPAPVAARKAPPEDPLCGIEYRADGEANFYTLSAATGSWIARIQFNGQFYPHEQERILSAMLGDRNVRYGDGYYDGYWSARKESNSEQVVTGIELAAKYVEQRADDYDRDHGSTDPETGTREYPGDGAEYMEELDNIAAGIRALAHQSGGAK